jgi:ribonuclease Z
VRAGSKTLLVDAGRGVTMRLAAAGSVPVLLDAVFLTHLHSDHICDLNDIVTTHWVMSQVPRPLRIFGPPRTRALIDGMRAMLQPDVEYRLAHHPDLTWAAPRRGRGRPLVSCSMKTACASSRPPPTIGPSSRRSASVEYGDAPRCCGDTVPCAELDELCRGADVYVQTVLRDDLVRMVPMQRFQDTIDYHSTVVQAAQTATRAGVKTLVLTHQVPTPGPGTAEEWTAIARAEFNGVIVFGEDLTSISV